MSLKKNRLKRKPYSLASDKEKIERNWNKTIGLLKRKEFSVAIIRCATSMELTVNYILRLEMTDELGLPPSFVDKLLKRANGIRGKYIDLFLPIMEDYEEHSKLKKLWNSNIEPINKSRNNIIHRGEFRQRKTAVKNLELAYEAINYLVDLFDKNISLKEIPKP